MIAYEPPVETNGHLMTLSYRGVTWTYTVWVCNWVLPAAALSDDTVTTFYIGYNEYKEVDLNLNMFYMEPQDENSSAICPSAT